MQLSSNIQLACLRTEWLWSVTFFNIGPVTSEELLDAYVRIREVYIYTRFRYLSKAVNFVDRCKWPIVYVAYQNKVKVR